HLHPAVSPCPALHVAVPRVAPPVVEGVAAAYALPVAEPLRPGALDYEIISLEAVDLVPPRILVEAHRVGAGDPLKVEGVVDVGVAAHHPALGCERAPAAAGVGRDERRGRAAYHRHVLGMEVLKRHRAPRVAVVAADDAGVD